MIKRGYSDEIKGHCLTLYCNGMGFRAIERSTGVCHNTVINWVEQASLQITEENYDIPETCQVDELYAERYPLGQTFVGSKKTRFG